MDLVDQIKEDQRWNARRDKKKKQKALKEYMFHIMLIHWLST